VDFSSFSSFFFLLFNVCVFGASQSTWSYSGQVPSHFLSIFLSFILVAQRVNIVSRPVVLDLYSV
jgi:hypothetical protein